MLVHTVSAQAILACRRGLLGLGIKTEGAKRAWLGKQLARGSNLQKPEHLLEIGVEQQARAVGKLHPALLGRIDMADQAAVRVDDQRNIHN
jgi:hypothetical protein